MSQTIHTDRSGTVRVKKEGVPYLMRKQQLTKLLALVLTFALIATACGGSDSSDEGASGSSTTTDTSTSADEPEEAMDDEEAMEDEEPEPAEDVVEAGTEAEGDVDTEVEVSTAPRQQGGELVVGLEAESEGLRPWEDTCASSCYNVFATIYDKLMESTADGNYEGWLFEEMTSNDDFTEWVGVLREGVTFHNGVDLTAQTIADMFPIQQAGSQSSSQIAASNLGDVQATGDYEVTYTMAHSSS